MVLPAFGVLTGGLNVLDRAFAPLFAAGALRAVLIGGGRLFPVAFSARCAARTDRLPRTVRRCRSTVRRCRSKVACSPWHRSA